MTRRRSWVATGGRTRRRITTVALIATGLLAGTAAVLAYRGIESVQDRAVQASAVLELQGIASLLTDGLLPLEFQAPLPYQVSTRSRQLVASSEELRVYGAGQAIPGGEWDPEGMITSQKSTRLRQVSIQLPESATPAQHAGEVALGVATFAELGTAQAAAVGLPARTTVRVEVFTAPFADTGLLTLTRHVLAALVPGALLVIGLVVWFAVGLALRPVEQLRQRVEEVPADVVGRSVQEPHTRDEVQSLARTLNGLLNRIDASDARQKVFVADAAHELRSPIATMIAVAEVAERYPSAADFASTTHTLLRQARRLERLAEDLLLLARLEGDADLNRRTTVDLAEVMSTIIDAIHTPGIHLNVHVEQALLLGDRPDLERLLLNLVANAARHAEHELEVRVEVCGRGTSKPTVQVTIWNDGASIPETDRETVFQRFVRLDYARTGDGGGAGLGLSIARRIAERHGGTLAISDRSPGTEMVFETPTADRATRLPNPRIAQSNAIQPPS